MLQIAIPNKGALSDGTVALFKEAGYRCSRSGRELMLTDSENEINFVFLRPRDIAIYVGNGIIDLGITGRDLALDSMAQVIELQSLNFGRSSFRYAVPEESNLTPNDFANLRIATSYPEIVRTDLAKRGIEAQIVRLDGAVEISIKLGVADAIADVVESGLTLKEAKLKIVGEPLMESEAILIARNHDIAENAKVQQLMARLRGILLARAYAMIEYDVPCDRLETCCKLTPGIEAPTVSPLSRPDWVAVKAMVKRRDANKIMDELHALGARGIIISELYSCRL